MKTFNVIIAYDITDDKRLKKISKLLQNYGCRIQLSIFLILDTTKSIIEKISLELIKLMDKNEDDIRIYKISLKDSISLNNAINLKSPTIFTEGCKNE
jgi:CRISPR-associated protein Cas2